MKIKVRNRASKYPSIRKRTGRDPWQGMLFWHLLIFFFISFMLKRHGASIYVKQRLILLLFYTSQHLYLFGYKGIFFHFLPGTNLKPFTPPIDNDFFKGKFITLTHIPAAQILQAIINSSKFCEHQKLVLRLFNASHPPPFTLFWRKNSTPIVV